MTMAFCTTGTLLGTPVAETDSDAGEMPGPAVDAAEPAAPLAAAAVAAAPVEALGADAPAARPNCR